MKQKLPIIFIGLAIVLALIAAVVTNRLVTNKIKQAESKRTINLPVVVAVDNIEVGTMIVASHLAIQQWPKTNVPIGNFNKIQDVEGNIARTPLLKGQAVLKTNLETKDITWGLSSLISKGMRAMTINIDEVIGVAGFLLPEDRVDVFATVEKGREFMENPASSVVLQNIKVLAVGEKAKEPTETKDPKEEKKERKSVKTTKVKVVTLEVNSEDARYLAIISSQCKLHLALRNPRDNVKVTEDKEGIELESVFPIQNWVAKNSELPKKTPIIKTKKPKQIYIEIIKGSQKTQQVLVGSLL